MYHEPPKESSKSVNTQEIDNLLDLMSGILTSPKEFIKEDGLVIR